MAWAVALLIFTAVTVGPLVAKDIKQISEEEVVRIFPADRGCPENDGFFWMASSRQCFKLMTDSPGLNWTDAKALCEEKMLKLAHPYDAIGLRSYLSQRYGKVDAYLNARGNGDAITWQDNEVAINIDSPLWREGAPYGGTVDNTKCLLIGPWTTKYDSINKPYWATPCHWKKSFRFPLCELDLVKFSG